MNHYEELGVAPSATTAEIRQAYKSLVRVLHPDQQQDENLRRLSELQLRRLNHLFQVLVDPEQRRIYDLSLQRQLPVLGPNGPPAHNLSQEVPWAELKIPFRSRIQPGVVVWMLIGAIAFGSAIFWFRWPEPAQPSRQTRPYAQASAKPAAQPDNAKAVSTPAIPARPALAPDNTTRNPAEPTLNERQQSLAKPPRYERATRDSREPEPRRAAEPKGFEPPPPSLTRAGQSESGPDVTNTTSVAVPPKNVEASPPPPIPKLASGSVSGKWLYVPRPDDTKTSLYPPEYIELMINNRAGMLRGRYYGKYRVSDRAISSEINFRFEGRQGDGVSVLPWAASNGSKGEMRLKRLSDESIEVNWITTSFGQANTLASGTAVLYRADP